jgi:hypothetical protein
MANFIRTQTRLVIISLVLLPAMQARGQTSAAAKNRVDSLVTSAASQFRIVYREEPVEWRHRYEQLMAAVSAWRHADHNQVNEQLMIEWLRSAIHNSMPGSQAGLPPMPVFAQRSPVEKTSGDPFRDDARE